MWMKDGNGRKICSSNMKNTTGDDNLRKAVFDWFLKMESADSGLESIDDQVRDIK